MSKFPKYNGSELPQKEDKQTCDVIITYFFQNCGENKRK